MRTTAEVLTRAGEHLSGLSGHIFDLLTVAKPVSPEAAVNLTKLVSKLSAMLGNLIEFNTVEYLNDQAEFSRLGTWKRQDPGFPDTVFESEITPTAGFEIKAWFPLSTEITARFKDSQNHFADDQTNVCVLAWLPSHLIYGKPELVGVCIVSGRSVAKARDDHYHRPPDYLVQEPEDTRARTRNLQQTNTSGHKWQSTDPAELEEARRIVETWGTEGKIYRPTPEYQAQLRELTSRFNYRLDTNYAKLDRIEHPAIEAFKARILGLERNGMQVQQWRRLLTRGNEQQIRDALAEHLEITEVDTANILQ